MTPKVGQFKFKRYYRIWAIYVIESICNGTMTSVFVKSVATYEDAVRETYRLNGWGEPKRIIKKF